MIVLQDLVKGLPQSLLAVDDERSGGGGGGGGRGRDEGWVATARPAIQ